jgi:hypothetical protein
MEYNSNDNHLQWIKMSMIAITMAIDCKAMAMSYNDNELQQQ